MDPTERHFKVTCTIERDDYEAKVKRVIDGADPERAAMAALYRCADESGREGWRVMGIEEFNEEGHFLRSDIDLVRRLNRESLTPHPE